ncbi:MAG: dipeptidyl-peptidase-4 [bacterium]|jgi:dipeptidyl-peptidase-4
MKNKVGLLLIALLVFTTIQAQDKMLTMRDAIVGYHLYPTGLSQLQWVGDDHYSYVDTLNGEKVIAIFEIESTNNGISQHITRGEIETALLKLGADSLDKLPGGVRWESAKSFRFYHKKQYFRYTLATKTATKLLDYDPGIMTHSDIGWESNNIAYVKDDNLWVNETQVSNDGGKGIVYAQATHRSEFGITNGTFWSDNGEHLAFYRMDESMVTEYPLYNLDSKPATTEMIRYPVAGDASHHVTVGIYNVAANTTVYLNTGNPKEQFLTNVSWGPNAKYVYIAVVNREQNHMQLKQFDATTGDFVKILFEEKNDKYVEPEHHLTFLKESPDEFIWWSERDGYTHLYLYNTDGKMVRELTEGSWEVIDFHGFSEDGKSFYITSTKESPINRDFYEVSFSNCKKMKKITSNEGSHRITPSPKNKHFLDDFSSTITPREIRVLGANGQNLGVLKSVENPLKEYKLGQMEIGTILANDGKTDLYYRLFKPIDFDATKQYPVVVYLYNGPHAQMINNRWLGGANIWFQYMAQQGFVVFTVDGRGSANRGFEFESVIHRQCGTIEMEDQLSGVEFLKKQPWVDARRLGIHGWSYGGFMTTSLMTRKPGTFQVGVAGGPVIDWRYYEIMYTERYMDTPEENPEGYKNNNLLNYVDQLEGKLLMIHGGQDNVVLWQHSLMYLQKNIQSGNSNLDYFVYPHHQHNVGGMDRVHLYQKITDYFMLYLK